MAVVARMTSSAHPAAPSSAQAPVPGELLGPGSQPGGDQGGGDAAGGEGEGGTDPLAVAAHEQDDDEDGGGAGDDGELAGDAADVHLSRRRRAAGWCCR